MFKVPIIIIIIIITTTTTTTTTTIISISIKGNPEMTSSEVDFTLHVGADLPESPYNYSFWRCADSLRIPLNKQTYWLFIQIRRRQGDRFTFDKHK